MEQITLKKSNSRTVVSVAAAVDGLSISSEVTVKDGILTRIEGNCSASDGRTVWFSISKEGDDYTRSQNGSESLVIEGGEAIEAYIAAVKAEYTELSTTDAEE